MLIDEKHPKILSHCLFNILQTTCPSLLRCTSKCRHWTNSRQILSVKNRLRKIWKLCFRTKTFLKIIIRSIFWILTKIIYKSFVKFSSQKEIKHLRFFLTRCETVIFSSNRSVPLNPKGPIRKNSGIWTNEGREVSAWRTRKVTHSTCLSVTTVEEAYCSWKIWKMHTVTTAYRNNKKVRIVCRLQARFPLLCNVWNVRFPCSIWEVEFIVTCGTWGPQSVHALFYILQLGGHAATLFVYFIFWGTRAEDRTRDCLTAAGRAICKLRRHPSKPRRHTM